MNRWLLASSPVTLAVAALVGERGQDYRAGLAIAVLAPW